jgi:hypothetical protein
LEGDKPTFRPMRAGGPTCIDEGVQSTGGTKMEMTMIEQPTVDEGGKAEVARERRSGTLRVAPPQVQAEADQQVAEIAKTFSVRWEW